MLEKIQNIYQIMLRLKLSFIRTILASAVVGVLVPLWSLTHEYMKR